MTLDEIREQLLSEHRSLRELARSVEFEAERLARGPHDLAALRASLAVLEDAVRAHNLREDDLLRAVLPTVDAWGPLREKLMDERHDAEHEAVLTSLSACATIEDSLEASSRARSAVALWLAHVEQEEREILSPNVLTDEIVRVEFIG